MKKIPTVFVRDEVKRQLVTRVVTPGCEWVLMGEGVATYKWNGTACLVKDGKLFARYDAKNGKTPPPDFVPADAPDPVTGHWPGWVPVTDEPQWRWHREAFGKYEHLADATYELIGPKVAGNPHRIETHILIRHGDLAGVPGGCTMVKDWPSGALSFESIRDFFARCQAEYPNGYIEGIVFWRTGEPGAKIKASDFGIGAPKKR